MKLNNSSRTRHVEDAEHGDEPVGGALGALCVCLCKCNLNRVRKKGKL